MCHTCVRSPSCNPLAGLLVLAHGASGDTAALFTTFADALACGKVCGWALDWCCSESARSWAWHTTVQPQASMHSQAVPRGVPGLGANPGYSAARKATPASTQQPSKVPYKQSVKQCTTVLTPTSLSCCNVHAAWRHCGTVAFATLLLATELCSLLSAVRSHLHCQTHTGKPATR